MRTINSAVFFAFAAFLAAGHAASQSPTNIAKPISRTLFENRIWKADRPPSNRLVHTETLSSSDDIDKHITPCKVARSCSPRVFTAGTGYLLGFSGPRNTVKLPAHNGSYHLAVLSEFVQAEGLTNAYLTLFEETEVMPRCQVPIEVPAYEYGSWRIRGVYPVSGDKRLAWLEASGGDAGFIWSLNVFLHFTPKCLISRWEAHYASAFPEGCTKKLPQLDSFFTVRNDGEVRHTVPRPSCLNIKIAPDRKVRVGAGGT